ncbi:MAG: ROK family transcriptional regulator [Anaerolineales bacterium]
MQTPTPRPARVRNSQLILKTIYGNGPLSRADLARETSLTPPTVSDVVASLIESGLVEEVGLAPSSSGRRPILLRVVDGSRQLIGIDLSREDFRGALVNLRGQIGYRKDLPLEGRDGDAALALVYDLVDVLVERATNPVLGIGIGAPGLVDAANGVLQQSVNLNWRYIPFAKLLRKRYNLPVYMANDSQAGALAIYIFSQLPKKGLPLVLIELGWGVGAGIIVNGQLLHGSPVGAGEIGHITINPDGDQCACGNYGCLETIASSRSIIKRVRMLAKNNPKSAITNLVSDPEQIDMDTISLALETGNEDVHQVIKEAGEALGIAASNLIGVLGSCQILIHGSVARFGQLLLDPMREVMDQRTLPSLARGSEIGIASIESDIVIQGASALILQNELGVL